MAVKKSFQDRKIQDGESVLLPNGKSAVVESAWNAHSHNEGEPDEWTYHVDFPGKGLGGRLNYKEGDLKVKREVSSGVFSYRKP
jgi:hypothetical protein